MLETIREYAVERLAQNDDGPPTRRRHEDHFAALASRAQGELLGTGQREWLDRLDADRDNLRAALTSAAEDGRGDVALGMGAALWRFWQRRAHLAEGRTVLEGLLDMPVAASRTAARSKALAALGGVRYWQGDLAAAGQAYAEALAIERELDDPSGLAEALYDAGFVAAITGDHATARADYEESLEIYRRLGDDAGSARLREALVFLMFHHAEFDDARAIQEENVRAFRAARGQFRIANGLNLLSAIQLSQGDCAGAFGSLAEAIDIFAAAGDEPGMIRSLILAAAAAVGSGDTDRAARLRGAADVLKEPLGDVATPMTILRLADPADAARAQMGAEAFDRAYQLGRRLSIEEAIALVSG